MTHIGRSEKVFIMKKLLLILILTFCFQSWAKADDISDFQIEGISIGNSLLKFYKKNTIKKSILKKQGYNDNSFVRGVIRKKNLTTYDAIQFHFKKNDKKYVLFNLAGILDFPNRIDDCNIKRAEITNDLSELFKNARTKKNQKNNHPGDKEKKSYVYTDYFFLKSGDAVRVQCYDWSKKSKVTDHLKITLDSGEYIDWIKNKAWK